MDPELFYKSLADQVRLKALLLIDEAGEACVCDLMVALDLDQPKTSRKLMELRKCGVLQDERRGKWVYYRLNSNLPQWCREVLETTARSNPGFVAKERQRLKSSIEKTRICCA